MNGLLQIEDLEAKPISKFWQDSTSKTLNICLYLHHRAVVENAISMIKKWKICKLPFHKDLSDMATTTDTHHKVWVVCSALCNLYCLPLRQINAIKELHFIQCSSNRTPFYTIVLHFIPWNFIKDHGTSLKTMELHSVFPEL